MNEIQNNNDSDDASLIDVYVGTIMDNGDKWTNAIYYNPARFMRVSKDEQKYVDQETFANQGQGYVSVHL